MSTCGTGIQAKLDPRNVWFGRNETYCVDTVADVADSLHETYFTFEDAQGNAFYAWFDTGGGVDPAPGGTAFPVTINTGDSAAAVASALSAAFSASTDFYSEVKNNQVLIVVKELGSVANAIADGAAATGFTFNTLLSGSLEELGKTSAPITFTPDVTTLEIKSDQNGETLEDELITGFNVVISSSFQELTDARLLDIVGNGEGGTLLGGWGYGTAKVGSSRFSNSGTLLLLSDKGEQPLALWKTVADLNGLNFSGLEQQVGELEFRAYVDNTKQDAINMSYYGDYLQDGLWK